MARRRTRKKIKKVDPEGIVHIHSTFNNTIVTVTDKKGNTITWASAGTIGYKGTKKSTPFAASLATEKAVKDAMNLGLKAAEIWIKGPGSGREAAIRSVQAAGLKVTAIKDVTPIPHNGCRPPKKRRV
ncbi:30S ribosomal protein S11 [bacterium]|uniref:Small ribosomal subunit protein uS11 n=1 Tax=candidate division WOR-3 bacterium TaxID=2052148 RepID=A0A7C0VC09_UNCW3|nr:MAG: 30S ribosomal protein S11 [bacterium]RKZ20608.1 MAG: 30S ribosomal protein S11 [bacterium]HDI83046.1 30S ribosomal protein S11 [candidate division WOR-3 bacterium]